VLASAGKRLLDLLLATLAVVLTSPWLIAAATAIKCDDPHAPVIYKQLRIGLNGRRFTVYKLRTMVQGADQQPVVSKLNIANGFKIRDDPRITKPGRWIRKLSFDELPQFWNVLRGEMSIVGPRPVVPDEVIQYPDDRYRRRFSVKPGITGLWQVSGRNDMQYDRRMELDLEYIDNWSLGRDLRIIAQTIPSVLTGRGAS
jgi:lipopolysaccharide/colanic/teichoic acid biosynthesis glycosyltransferase